MVNKIVMESEKKPQKRVKKKVKINWLALKFDRLFSSGAKRQLLIIIGCFAVVFLIGCAAMYAVGYTSKLEPWQWAFYLLVDTNALNNIYIPEQGHRAWVLLFSTLISMAGVVIFGGMFISVCSNLLNRRIESYRNGDRTYLKAGHYVILGYDSLVPAIITDIFEKDPEAYVLLHSSFDGNHVRELLSVTQAAPHADRVIVKRGHRTNSSNLKKLYVGQAVEVYVAGDRTLPQHDALNIECVKRMAEILKGEQDVTLTRIVMILENPDTYTAMQVADMFEDIRNLGVELIPYNHNTACAQKMLIGGSDAARPGWGGIAPDDPRHVHLVIAGMTELGTTVAVEAAKVLHFPNFDGAERRTRITMIDAAADTLRHRFIARCRHFFEVQSHGYADLSAASAVSAGEFLQWMPATKFEGADADFLDVEFVFIKADPSSLVVHQLLGRWAEDDRQRLTLAVALDDSRLNMGVAMHLPDQVYERAVPVWVQQEFSGWFLEKLRSVSAGRLPLMTAHGDTTLQGRYAHIYPFGMTDHFASNDDVQVMAECINHVYDVYFGDKDGFTREKVMDAGWDEIHAKWKKLTVDNQWASFYSATGVSNVLGSIRAMRGLGPDAPVTEVTDAELDCLAPLEHNRWMAERLLMGYRKPAPDEDSGRVDDPARREAMKKANKKLFIHSDIRPYADLDGIHKLDSLILDFIPWYQEMVKKHRE